jgi:uncharacterized protein YwgA
MNSAHIVLKLVLDQAGISDVSLDTFSQRFNIQKRIYLIQLIGHDLGYRYGWYLRGPYSRNLTVDAFTLRDELAGGDKEYEGLHLPARSTQRIERAKRLWAVPAALAMGNDEWLELLASLHYLKHIAYWPKDSDKNFEAVFRALIAAKPQFDGARHTAQAAWRRLDAFGLIASKTVE